MIEPIFELTETNTYIGVWVVPSASGGNWITMAWRTHDKPGEVHIKSRLRKNTSGDPSPWSDDEKVSREDVLAIPSDADDMIFRTICKLAADVALGYARVDGLLEPGEPAVYAIRVDGPGSKVMAALKMIPGCETMTISRYGGES